MLKLLKAANQFRGRLESRAMDEACAAPEKTQRELLLKLLAANAESSFGKAHGFAEIRSETAFRRNVPSRDYEDFRPYINRVINGERAVLTEENPFMLTMTSGTTSEPKYVPVTRESQRRNASLMRQWLYRAELDHRGLTAQASFGIVSRAVEGFTASGTPFGSASGVIYKNIPWFIRRAYAVPYLVSEIEDYDARYFVLARFALARRVSFIATPNPSTLLRFAQVCAAEQENLIRAIHDGTLGLAAPEQSNVCRELSAMLKPNPARAAMLARIASETDFLRPADCWSDLKLVGCWLGGSVGACAGKLAEFYGGAPLRDLGFMASEGHLTLPFEDETSTGILALRNNFYEFVPEAEIDSQQPTYLFSHELEAGTRYAVLLTNAAGLYRYRMNDIIEVTGFYRRAPLVAFVRKAGEMANITGEKMHANHLLEAFDFVSRKFNLKIEQFYAAPNYDCARYEIYLESASICPNELANEIDDALCRCNLEYEQKRRSKRLHAARLHLMKIGWANECFRRRLAAGRRDTQDKPLILRREPAIEDAPFVVRVIEANSSKSAAAKICF